MSPVRFTLQGDQIVIRRHQCQFGDVLDGVARVDGDHDGIDLMDHVRQSDFVALFQQAAKVLFEKR